MITDKGLLSGEQLRLELLGELKKLREFRPGPGEFFSLQPIWDTIRKKHEQTIDKELAEVFLNSLLQEKLARILEDGGTWYIQITTDGLDYLKRVAKESQKQEIVVEKQIIIGSITDSIVNVDAILENVTQNIGSANNIDEAAKKQLTDLIEQLKTELQKVPSTNKEAAEAVAESAEEFVRAGTKGHPNKPRVQITADGLKKAAENMAGVMPTVLTIASSIVKTVFQLAGIPLP